jgi:hypothetical protein
MRSAPVHEGVKLALVGKSQKTFKCPFCGWIMGGRPVESPNWTTMASPYGGYVVVLSCLNAQCSRVIGTYWAPAD